MFAKLLKYEWKASCRTLGILTLAVLGLGPAAICILRVITYLSGQIIQRNPFPMIVIAALSMSLVFMGIAAAVYTVATQFLLLYRFYRHKFTDEGYLTFTLPATPQQLFLSSYVNMLLWAAISGVTVFLSVFLAILFGPVENGLINREALQGIGEVIRNLLGESIFGMTLFPACAALLCTPLIGMSCITVGAVLAKKHKLLTAFGIYYAFNAVTGIISSVLMFIVSIVSYQNGELFLILSTILQTMIQVGAAIGGSLLSVRLMKTKLNLP